MILCRNFSIENDQCRYNYTPGAIINLKDLKPNCKGQATIGECCWYHIGKFTPFISDKKMKIYRNRFQEKPEVKPENLRQHIETRDKKELEIRAKLWE